MKNKKKISFISSIFLVGSIVSPFFLTSCKNIQNYKDGIVLDGETNDSFNNVNRKGSLSSELSLLEDENIEVKSMSVSNTIKFQDYQNDKKDSNGNTLFIHERGPLIEKQLQTTIKQNKDDFINKFNLKSYINGLPESDKQILNPSNEKFVKDLKLFMSRLFHENNEFFDVDVKETNSNSIVSYNQENNTISFDITFILKNVSKESKTFKYLNISNELHPDVDVEFSLSVKDASITNVVNYVSGRYLLGWEVGKVNFKIGSSNGIIESFVPTKNSISHAYNLEFFNLSTELADYSDKSNNSQEFMDSLSEEFIKEKLNENILSNQKTIFSIFPDIAMVFDALGNNLTLGETLSNLSKPLSSMLKKFNVAPDFFIDFASELLKSLNTGKSVLKIFVEYKEKFVEFISTSLGASFGDLSNVISMIFDPISLDMTEESKKEILNFFNTLTFPGVDQVKELVSRVFNNFSLIDLLDYALTNLKDLIESALTSMGINDETYNLIFEIINKLIDREKDTNGNTIINGEKIFYKNNILDIFFESADTKKWLYDSISKILKTYGTDLQNMQKGLLDNVINQVYVNNSKISISSIQTLFEELKKAFSFFGDSNNYEIIFETKKDVSYDKKTRKIGFDITSKVVLKKDYSFELSKLFNLLPKTITLSFEQLNVQDQINKYKYWLELLGFSSTHITLNTNLITRIFPNRISFREKDAFAVNYTPIDGKLFYKQHQKLGNYYHGFNSMLNAYSYIEQRANNDGVISNLYKEFNEADDYRQYAQNLIQYEYQPEQNYKMFDVYTQNLLVNRINTTVWFNGYDESQKVISPINDSLYREAKVFRWYDTDYNNELFKIGSSNFRSSAFENVVSKIKYKDTNLPNIKVTRIKDSNNSMETKEISRKEAYFDWNDQIQIANTLYYFGNGIKPSEEVTQTIKPLFHFKTSKDIGIGLSIFNNPINLKKININIELLAFEASIMLPYNVLDVTDYYKDGNGTNILKSVKFSNQFSKTFVIPRVSVVL